MKLVFCKAQLEKLEVLGGLEALTQDFPFAVAFEGEGLAVEMENVAGEQLSVCFQDNKAKFIFDFTRRNHFFRCLSLLLEQVLAGKTECCLKETAYFRYCGPMIDLCQGSAAINVRQFKNLLRRMAIMGLNQCLMYMEDTFDVPEEPYFGYMRARYSFEELRELDDYAYSLGIEMIPASQGLAHYRDVLKWSVYREIREDPDCLLPEAEETYEFLRHVIIAASKPFRTKRINLLMDEATLIGQGTYLKLHGLTPKFEIMQRHIRRVFEITQELGLRPMVSGDMFFNALGSNYRQDIEIPQEYIDSMPKGFDMIYWDYYGLNGERYRKLIDLRKQLAEKVIFEGGIWTWVGFAPNWTMTRITTDLGLDACKEKGVDDIQATIWGDSGTECDIRMVLWGLQLFAEHCFMREAPSEEHLRRRFAFCTGGNYDLFYAMQRFDRCPGVTENNTEQRNPSKFLVWQDPLHGLFDKNIEGLPLKAYYKELADFMDNADFGNYASMFEFYRRLAHVLELKCELGLDIHKAYFAKDTNQMREIAQQIIPELIERVRAMRQQHYVCWKENNKMMGWEIFDMRYGSLIIRLETAAQTLTDYVEGRLTCIEELEEKQINYDNEEGIPVYANFSGRIVSAGRIAPEDYPLMPKMRGRKRYI